MFLSCFSSLLLVNVVLEIEFISFILLILFAPITGLGSSDFGLQENVKPTTTNIDENDFKDGPHFTATNLDFYGNIFGNHENIMDKLAQIEKEIKEDEDIATKSALLLKLLQVGVLRFLFILFNCFLRIRTVV